MKKNKIKSVLLSSMVALSLVFGVACSTDSTATTTASAGASQVKDMAGADLAEKNEKDKDSMLLIDVRAEEQYKAGHIAHAIHIPLADFEARVSEIEDFKNKPVVLYCNTGKQSGEAADILINKGFTDVTNADGVKEHEYKLVTYTDMRGAEFEKMASGDDVVVVDVRDAKAAADTGMIAGAVNIPLAELEANLDKLPKDKTIAIYCNSGNMSSQAAQKLVDQGYENVVNAIDGVKEFEFTLVK